MHPLIYLLLQFATLAYALLGGVFLAFSDFIMRALTQTGARPATVTMQSINRAVFRWVFMALFLGMAGTSLLLIGLALLFLDGAERGVILLAGAVYLVGCFVVTAARNVPMNTILADLDPQSEAAEEYWLSTYLPRWTFWNTVRTIACTLAAALLMLGTTLALQDTAPL